MRINETEIYQDIPEEELNNWYNRLHLKPCTLIVIFGIGNGIYIKKLIENLTDDIRILLYEPKLEMLNYLTNKFDLINIMDNDHIFVYTNEIDSVRLNNLFKQFIYIHNADRVLFLTYPKYEILYKKEHIMFSSHLKSYTKRINTKNRVIIKYGKTYIKNIFHNFNKYFKDSYLYDDIKESIDTSLPVFIISAGPSLDKNIKELKSIKGRGCIIAVDSAMSALFKVGIVPDLIVSVDANKNMNHLSKNYSTVPLLTYLTSNSDLLDNHNGDKVFIDSGEYYFHVKQLLKDSGILLPKFATGGSVSCTALSIAINLGFSDIVLVGLDLAYTGNKTYSEYTLSKDKAMENGQIYLDGNYEDKVLSTKIFEIYLNWYNMILNVYKNIRVYNATEGGAKINSTTLISLKDCIVALCNCKPKRENNIKLSNKMPNILDSSNYKSQVIEKLLEYKKVYANAESRYYNIIDNYDNINEEYKMIYYITYRIQKQINELILESMRIKKYSNKYFSNKASYCGLIVHEIDNVIDELNKMD